MAFTIGGETEHYQPKDPDTPECSWCDGTLMVEVGSIIDVGGENRAFELYELPIPAPEIECPRCREHPGVEPVAPREDR